MRGKLPRAKAISIACVFSCAVGQAIILLRGNSFCGRHGALALGSSTLELQLTASSIEFIFVLNRANALKSTFVLVVVLMWVAEVSLLKESLLLLRFHLLSSESEA